MGILNAKATRELNAFRDRAESAEKKIVELEGMIIDQIDAAIVRQQKYTGNAYKDYGAIIQELANKYEAKSEWGCVQAGNIIDVRAAFIIGQGVNVGPADKTKAEDPGVVAALKFAKVFFAFNDLDREMAQELAKEAEIEGCFLGTLKWDAASKQVSIRFTSRVETNYTIKYPKEDYADYKSVEWKDGSSPMKLDAPNFVYGRFGGRVHKPNEPTPKVGKCLTEIEALSKALRDWREINRLFGSPKPHIECDTAEQAKYAADNIKAIASNWRIRQLFAHTGKLLYLVPSAESRQGIENEIITLAKMISGATGCPVHFMGFPDLLSNRATADNLMELVASSTQKERECWVGIFQEMIEKAAAIYNSESQLTAIDASLLKVSIPSVAPETWQRLVDVWLPMYVASAISLQTFLEQVPGVDAGAEKTRIDEQDKARVANLMTRPNPIPGDPNADPNGTNPKGNPAAFGKSITQAVNYKNNPGSKGLGV